MFKCLSDHLSLTCWYVPAATVGQSCVLQSAKSPDDPGHSSPPLAGLGLSQILDRDFLPPAHVLVQEPHCCHAPHAPSTKNRTRGFFYTKDTKGTFLAFNDFQLMRRTYADLCVASLGARSRVRTARSSVLRGRVGARACSILGSSAARDRTRSPASPWGPDSINWQVDKKIIRKR